MLLNFDPEESDFILAALVNAGIPASVVGSGTEVVVVDVPAGHAETAKRVIEECRRY